MTTLSRSPATKPDGADAGTDRDPVTLTPSSVSDSEITAGGFTEEITIPAEASATSIIVTAVQTVNGVTHVTSAAFTVGVEPLPAATLSSYVATEATRIELPALAVRRIPAGEEITVTLKKFGLPSDIPESSVLILGTTSTTAPGYVESPEELPRTLQRRTGRGQDRGR